MVRCGKEARCITKAKHRYPRWENIEKEREEGILRRVDIEFVNVKVETRGVNRRKER